MKLKTTYSKILTSGLLMAMFLLSSFQSSSSVYSDHFASEGVEIVEVEEENTRKDIFDNDTSEEDQTYATSRYAYNMSSASASNFIYIFSSNVISLDCPNPPPEM